MSGEPDHLESYPLFYEEIGQTSPGQAMEFEQTKQEAAYERDGGLSDREVAQLSEDLRRPMTDSSSTSSEEELGDPNESSF
jgi:hypothetical protein